MNAPHSGSTPPGGVDACAYCGLPISQGDTTTVCPSCFVVHHFDCWKENHGCSAPGCGVSDAQKSCVRTVDGKSEPLGHIAAYDQALKTGDASVFLARYHPASVGLADVKDAKLLLVKRLSGRFLLVAENGTGWLYPTLAISRYDVPEVRSCFWLSFQRVPFPVNRFLLRVSEPAHCESVPDGWLVQRMGRIEVTA